MNSKRLYFILLASLIILIVLAFAGVYFGHQSLVSKNTELSQLKAKAIALEDQERSLVLAKKDIEQYKELRDISRTIVPQEKDQARTVREVIAIADSVGITIANVSFPSSNLGEDLRKSKTSGVSQVAPVEGIPGLFELNVDVRGGEPVSFATLSEFLERLETNRRTSTISSAVITPTGGDDGLLEFTLALKVFIKP